MYRPNYVHTICFQRLIKKNPLYMVQRKQDVIKSKFRIELGQLYQYMSLTGHAVLICVCVVYSV